jgi:serine/threonine-protein kinase
VSGGTETTQFAAGSAGDLPAGVPRVGDVIADKYRVDAVIGVGGMGVVLAVTHLQLQEPYAIKFLLPKTALDLEVVARFIREARAAVRIKSEHIARVSDVGQREDGVPYIVMEHLVGQDLGAVVAERGPLPISEAVEYVLQACEGIAEAHALGIVHRDLKPANLFLTRRSDGLPFVKVLDFGISKIQDADAKSPTLTDTKSVFGSPAYMSPEQIRSAKNVDARTDVWALGVILHELLTGRMPFLGDTAAALLAAISADEPEPVRVRRPDVSPELEDVVRRCLVKSPDARVASVADLAAALDPFKSEASIASLGRIRRLSGPPGATPSVPAPARSAPRSSPITFGATDAPVTRAATRPRSKLPAFVVVLVGVALACGAIGYLSSRFTRSTVTSVVAQPPPPAPPTPSFVTAAPAVTVPAGALPAVVSTPSASVRAVVAKGQVQATRRSGGLPTPSPPPAPNPPPALNVNPPAAPTPAPPPNVEPAPNPALYGTSQTAH